MRAKNIEEKNISENDKCNSQYAKYIEFKILDNRNQCDARHKKKYPSHYQKENIRIYMSSFFHPITPI